MIMKARGEYIENGMSPRPKPIVVDSIGGKSPQPKTHFPNVGKSTKS